MSCVLQEFHLTLQAMKDAVEGVAKQPSITYTAQPGVTAVLVSQLAWLLGTAAGFAQKMLSKADVAAVFLSRKILLDRISLKGGLPPACLPGLIDIRILWLQEREMGQPSLEL